jgi:hypothetical protein
MLDVPDEDGVRRLLRPEPREPPSLGGPLRLDHLLSGEGRRAEVPDLAERLEVGQRAQGLLDVRVRLGSVDLVQVDVIRARRRPNGGLGRGKGIGAVSSPESP